MDVRAARGYERPPASPVDEHDDSTDEAPMAPRPWGVTAVGLGVSFLSVFQTGQAEEMLSFLRGTPPAPADFLALARYALWSCAQEHRRALVAIEAARIVTAVLLFVASARVLLRARDSGWLWRQALGASAAVALASAWYEHALVPSWAAAFRRALPLATAPIPSPVKGLSLEESFRRVALVSSWATGLLAAVLLAALAFANRERTRAFTG